MFCIQNMRPIYPEPDLSERYPRFRPRGDLLRRAEVRRPDHPRKRSPNSSACPASPSCSHDTPAPRGLPDRRRPQGRSCVAPLDVQQARNLYVVRAAPRLAPLPASPRRTGTPHPVQRGRALLDVGRRAVASGYVPSVIEADIDFHLFVCEASGNPADQRDRPSALARICAGSLAGRAWAKGICASVCGTSTKASCARSKRGNRPRPKRFLSRPCRTDGRHSRGTIESRDFPRRLKTAFNTRQGGTAMKLTSE